METRVGAIIMKREWSDDEGNARRESGEIKKEMLVNRINRKPEQRVTIEEKRRERCGKDKEQKKKVGEHD